MARDTLRDQTLSAWRVNNEVNLKLVRAIPRKGFVVVPLASPGRDVARQLLHLHKVRVGWIKYSGFTSQRWTSLTAITSYEKRIDSGVSYLHLLGSFTRTAARVKEPRHGN
jgi:uncharacterized damage-inducible protein DinB